MGTLIFQDDFSGITKPLVDRIRDAKYVISNHLIFINPRKTIGGYIEYINSNGDWVYAYGDDDKREIREIQGFNIERIADHSYLNGINYHEAHESNTGLVVIKSGALWNVLFFDELKERMISPPERCSKAGMVRGYHSLYWDHHQNIIYGRLGAGIYPVAYLNPLGPNEKVMRERTLGKERQVIVEEDRSGSIISKRRPRGEVIQIKRMGQVEVIF